MDFSFLKTYIYHYETNMLFHNAQGQNTNFKQHGVPYGN